MSASYSIRQTAPKRPRGPLSAMPGRTPCTRKASTLLHIARMSAAD